MSSLIFVQIPSEERGYMTNSNGVLLFYLSYEKSRFTDIKKWYVTQMIFPDYINNLSGEKISINKFRGTSFGSLKEAKEAAQEIYENIKKMIF